MNLLSLFYFYFNRRKIVALDTDSQRTHEVSATSASLTKMVPSQNRNFFPAKINIIMNTYKEIIHGGLARSLFTIQTNLTSNSVDWNALLFQSNSLILIVTNIHKTDSKNSAGLLL